MVSTGKECKQNSTTIEELKGRSVSKNEGNETRPVREH